MAQSYKDRPTPKASFLVSLRESAVELFWKLMALGALIGCTLLGWYVFQLARENSLDSTFAQIYRTVTVTLQVMFRLDPVLALIVFPFAVVVILVLIGLLIWLHKDR